MNRREFLAAALTSPWRGAAEPPARPSSSV